MPFRHVNETVTAVTVVTIIIIVTFVRTVKKIKQTAGNNGIKRVAIKFEGLTVLALEGFFGFVW